MKTWMAWTMLLLLASAPAARGQRNIQEDRSAPVALVTLPDASRWEAGLGYARISRGIDLEGSERHLRANLVDVGLGLWVMPWMQVYGRVGAAEARVVGSMDYLSAWAAGVVGAKINLWQMHQGDQVTAWRFTIPVEVQYAYRTTREDDAFGELKWSETMVTLPLSYHLSFARTFRNFFMSEWNSLQLTLGPAYSVVSGTWMRNSFRYEFEEQDAVGIVGGVELWLLDNLSFAARAEWFGDTTLHLGVRYRF